MTLHSIWSRARIVLCLLVLSHAQLVHANTTAAVPEDRKQAHDAALKTSNGTPFLVPAGWTRGDDGALIVLSAPDSDARIAITEVAAPSADEAIAQGWQQLRRERVPVLKESRDRPARFGWSHVRSHRYEDAREPDRWVRVLAMRDGHLWTVLFMDLSSSAMERRESQVTRVISSLRARHFVAPTLAGTPVRDLDAARIDALRAFLDDARKRLAIPGAALGIVQNGKVKFAGGLGVREIGSDRTVDASTLFLTASITKPLTSLLLAKLVDNGRIGWDTPVRQAMPAFKVGDPTLSGRIRIRHLLCACTGIPPRDMEWIFSGETMRAQDVISVLGRVEPTAGIGELYQYSNLMAAVGGIVGGHVAEPAQPLDAAYDLAMQRLVLDPLGMSSTTFDFDVAERGDHARPHGVTAEGRTVAVPMDFNRTGMAMRADGGAWSNVDDLVRYLQMELAHGRLPDGRRYIGRAALEERYKAQVARGGLDQWYGMGLKTDRQRGILQVRHGGNMAGYQGEIFWLPEHDAGFVLLMNADAGSHLRSLFVDRFIETLFETDLGTSRTLEGLADSLHDERTEKRKSLEIPVNAQILAQLASRYTHPELGTIEVIRDGHATWLDFGGWKSEVASLQGHAGKQSLESVSPSVEGYRFEVRQIDGRRALVLSDGQREYTFFAVPGSTAP
jgi:CubicO group peptidase (beta-lactamase class C family)